MEKLKVILVCGKYYFEKCFEQSFIPQDKGEIMIPDASDERAFVSATVKRPPQYYLGQMDFVQLWCDITLKSLCILYLGQTGWLITDQADFENDPVVKKNIAEIKDR